MKRILAVVLLVVFGAVSGCGKDDPNKNLKPVDPNAPKPSAAGTGPGGNKDGAKVTAPSTPP